jgi:hypothetical protein
MAQSTPKPPSIPIKVWPAKETKILSKPPRPKGR